MSIEEIKKEIKVMNSTGLRELSTFLLQVRRAQDPERRNEIADLIDSPDNNWVSLDDFEDRLKD